MAAGNVIDARALIPLKGRKGAAVDALCAVICEFKLSYSEFVQYSKQARDRMELSRPKTKPVNKPIPSEDDIAKFMKVVETQSTKDALMMKLLIYLGIRSVELVRIKIEDIDTTPGAERIFVHRKGGLDKWFVIPAKIASLLRMYLSNCDKQVYLFESGYRSGKILHKPYDTKSIRKKIQSYREQAGVGDVLHAHNFRHNLLTLLAAQGWSDSELQLVSGHSSRTSLDRYIYQNPELIRSKMNDACNNIVPGV